VAPKSGRKKLMGELIDSMVMPGIQGGPLMHVIAAKAIAFREALDDDFTAYTAQVILNAQAFAAAMVEAGYNVISGGTDNHLMLIDLRNKGLTGKKAENALDAAGITCNKNAVPFDTESPLVTSGIRLGSAAVTSRGMKEDDMRHIARLIDRVLTNVGKDDVYAAVKQDVKHLCSGFPIYPPLNHSYEESARRIEEGVEHLAQGIGQFMKSVGEEIQQTFRPKS
jgi:glycine hydroxymethyltransferase